jgi:hypothetical protein
MAVEMPFQELIEDAIRAGWQETKVITAIIEVADNLMLAAGTNAEIGTAPCAQAEAGVKGWPLRAPMRDIEMQLSSG